MKGGRQFPATHQPGAMHPARRERFDNLARTLRSQRDAGMKHAQIAASKNPRRLIWRRPLTELERELVSVTTKQERVDRRFQLAGAVVLAGNTKAAEPIHAAIRSRD